MKLLLRLEYAAMFLMSIYAFSLLPYSWYWFFILLLLPDVGMLGYSINAKVGSYTYNFFHSILTSMILLFVGLFFTSNIFLAMGIIVYAHVAMDRLLGYGLKYSDSFWHTHLSD